MNKVSYALAIYTMLCTRPDVSYALIVIRRYQSDPGEGHWVTVKNNLKYLRRTKDVFFVFRDGDLIVSGYTDAKFQSSENDSKSQLGYVFMLNGSVVSWKSSK